MALITKTRVKYVFAGIGAVYLVLIAGYLVYRGVTPGATEGPSDLEANPDRQEEILARRRALELQQQLKLSDEQADKIADIYQKNPEPGFPGMGGRGRGSDVRDQVRQVLTPEQQAQIEAEHEQARAQGGQRGRLTPERAEALKKNMTPEQQARFDKKFKEWEERRGQRGQRGGPGGPGGGRRGGGGGPGNGQGAQ